MKTFTIIVLVNNQLKWRRDDVQQSELKHVPHELTRDYPTGSIMIYPGIARTSHSIG